MAMEATKSDIKKQKVDNNIRASEGRYAPGYQIIR